MNFQQSLKTGQLGESMISRWLRSRGWHILPAYEKEIDTGKGPRLFSPGDKQLISPDMVAIHPTQGRITWIEAKHKTAFTWYRIGRCWNTGIDAAHFDDYAEIASTLPMQVWLFFLHKQSKPSAGDLRFGCPAACPSGLFVGEMAHLAKTAILRNGYANGMYYWKDSDLKKIASYQEVACVSWSHKGAA